MMLSVAEGRVWGCGRRIRRVEKTGDIFVLVDM